jgi:DNA polymerase-3 subunit alpha
VIVYQEQVMLISRIIGGFTPGQSDALRKAMGKKIKEKMEEMKLKFLDGAQKKGYEPRFATELYDQMARFAEYGFNKSHSAAYAMIVYRTAYMKARYPVEYMKALLDSEIGHPEKLVFYMNAVRDMGMKLLGPDVNESGSLFTCLDETTLRFGLSAIKNVGGGAVDSIILEREKSGKYATFFSFLEGVDLRLCNQRALESLISAGAFDTLGYTRKALIESLDMAIVHGKKSQSDKLMGQGGLFAMVEEVTDPIPRGEGVSEYPEMELLRKEKEVLGFYISGHPLSRFERILKQIRAVAIDGLENLRGGEKVELACVINEINRKFTKAGKEMAILQLEDMTGGIQALVFPNQLEKVKDDLIADVPVIVKGQVDKKDETKTVQFLVDSIQILKREDLEEKMERGLHVKLNIDQCPPQVIENIKTIVRGHKGKLSLFFHLNGSEERRVIRAHESFNVDYNTTLVERLKSIDEIQGLYLVVGDQIRDLNDKAEAS